MIQVNWSNDPEEELEHWQEIYSMAIGLRDSETINELKELLPILEERL